MISIFNGRSRKLGQGQQQDIHMQVSVDLRRHLHLFKGPSLAIFFCIALHSDKEGWSFPSFDVIQEETGYTHNAIYAALNHLCSVTIEDQRVLLKYQKTEKGKFGSNRYLIFPSPEEITRLDEPSPTKRVTNEPSPTKPSPMKRVTKKNQLKEEPTLKGKDHIKKNHPASSRATLVIGSHAEILKDFSIIIQRALTDQEEHDLEFLVKKGLTYHRMFVCSFAYVKNAWQIKKYGAPAVRTIFADQGKADYLFDAGIKELARVALTCGNCGSGVELTVPRCIHCGHNWSESFYRQWLDSRKAGAA